MEKNFIPLASFDKKTSTGIPLPVPTVNGCFVSYMIHQAPTLSFQTDNGGYKNSYTGKKDQWNFGGNSLPLSEFDVDGDGVWRGNPGQAWNSANTLVQNYGNGKIAFIAFFNQNRIDIPAGTKFFRFTYRAGNNQEAAFKTNVPELSQAVAFVKRRDGGTQLVWKINGVWTGGSVIRDSADPDCLAIKIDSINIE